MATKTIHVKLKGKGQLHQPVVRIEGINVNLWSPDSGVTWENPGVQLSVTGLLDVFMSCKAMTGTGWDFLVKDVAVATPCYTAQGVTGEPLPSQGGNALGNYSERLASINC